MDTDKDVSLLLQYTCWFNSDGLAGSLVVLSFSRMSWGRLVENLLCVVFIKHDA